MSEKTLNVLDIIEKHKSVIGIIILFIGFVVQYTKLESKVETNQEKFLENIVIVKDKIEKLEIKIDTLNMKIIKNDYIPRDLVLDEILKTINRNQITNALRFNHK